MITAWYSTASSSTLTEYAAIIRRASGSESSFPDVMSQRVQETEETAAPESAKTADDIKQEFFDYLDSLVISPGLANSAISVRVTDSAWEKMLADPEYMQKMKDLCARDLCDPAWNKLAAMGATPSASIITIDADAEEEYLASSFNSPSDRSKADGDDFWSRRKEKNKQAREDAEERAAEKKEMLKLLGERTREKKALAGAGSEYHAGQALFGKNTAASFPPAGYGTSPGSGPEAAARAGAAAAFA